MGKIVTDIYYRCSIIVFRIIFGDCMKWLVLILFSAVFILTVLNSPSKILHLSNPDNLAFAVEKSTSDSGSQNNPENAVIEEISKQYEQKIKYAIIIIFAVLFIAGVYWWTYGKLHHKLPRY